MKTRKLNHLSNEGRCIICCKLPQHPFRSHDQAGNIVHGCVGEAHTGHLKAAADLEWHNRDAAQALRQADRDARTIICR